MNASAFKIHPRNNPKRTPPSIPRIGKTAIADAFLVSRDRLRSKGALRRIGPSASFRAGSAATLLAIGSPTRSSSLALKMRSEPRGECFGYRHQTIRVVHFVQPELPVEKLEQVLDDVEVAQPQLMQGER